MGSMQQDKKVAIVTGSTSGIGADLAKNLHAKGYLVALTGRRSKTGEALASSLDATGETALFVQCDVSSYDSQKKLFTTVWNKWHQLDVLIANAGGVDRESHYNFGRRDAPVTELPPEPDFGCTDTDLKGVMYGTILATHFMRHNPTPGGKILVTGSVMGVLPCSMFPEYCAAKAGALQWVRTMSELLLPKEGITINIILPCAVDTPAMPDFSVAFLPEHLAIPETLISAYDVFLDDQDNLKTGQAVEVAYDKLFYHKVPEVIGGPASSRCLLVYEPWFCLMHGERSGLPNALPGPPNQAVWRCPDVSEDHEAMCD